MDGSSHPSKRSTRTNPCGRYGPPPCGARVCGNGGLSTPVEALPKEDISRRRRNLGGRYASRRGADNGPVLAYSPLNAVSRSELKPQNSKSGFPTHASLLITSKSASVAVSHVSRRNSSSPVDDFSPVRVQNLAGHVRGVLAGEKHEASSHFRRFTSAPQRHIGSEFLHFLSRKRRRNQWRPDRPRRHGIHSNLSTHQGMCQRPGETDDRSLRR
jgi:hypothetical protein